MKKLLPLFVVVCLIACRKDELPSSINSEVSNDSKLHGRETFTLDYLTYNECTAEWVAVSGILEFKFNYFTTKNDFNAFNHYQFKNALGIGLSSGISYKLMSHTFDVDKLKNYTTTQQEYARISTKLTFRNPDGTDWISQSVTIRKVLADGSVVVNTQDITSYCK
jgi:hypothetical protein